MKNRIITEGESMRKVISAILVLIVLVALVACGEKSETKTPANEEAVQNPIRVDELPFKTVIEGLRPVAKELALQTPVNAFKVSENIYEQSFAIGVISADAVLAISSKDDTKLKGYTEVLIEYSKNIGLKDEILKMADEIQSVLSNNEETKWEQLEKLILEYQTQVQYALYDAVMYDQFTLMQLGGWSEGLNKITSIYLKNWDEKAVKDAINQKAIINGLVYNLTYVQSKKIKESAYYNIAFDGFKEIKEIIYSISDEEFFSIEDIEKINKISAKIVESVRK